MLAPSGTVSWIADRRLPSTLPTVHWSWAAVPLIGAAVHWSSFVGGTQRLTDLIVALGLIAWLSRFPGPTLLALVLYLPFQTALFSFLYERGAPADLLRIAGATKEVLGSALLLGALLAIRRDGRRLDRLDLLILLFAAFVAAQVVAPALLGAEAAPSSWAARSLGFRTNVSFLLLFFAARHAPIGDVWRRRIVGTLVAAVGLIAALGLYQYLRPDRWYQFIVDDIGLLRYQTDILGVSHDAQQIGLTWMKERPVRTGSLLVSPFEFGDLMIVGTAVVMAYLVRIRIRAWAVALFGLGSVAILASHTRACLLGLVVAAVVVAWPVNRDTRHSRVRFLMLLFAAGAIVVPGLIGSRYTGANGANKSSSDHVREFTSGLQRVVEHPLGQGVGTAPNLSFRFGSDTFVSDNTILQVGEELGLVPMVLFVVILWSTARRLRRAAAGPGDDVIPLGVAAGLIGLLAAGMLHHVFLAVVTAWIMWAMAGLALQYQATPSSASPSRSFWDLLTVSREGPYDERELGVVPQRRPRPTGRPAPDVGA